MDLRPRRLRQSSAIRDLVRETNLRVDDLIYPLFVMPGEGIKEEIESLPGVYHFSLDTLLIEVERITKLGIRAVILFGLPEYKDDQGTSAYDESGVVQKAIRTLKEKFPDLYIITDVCLCQYTSHGHCGLIHQGEIINDPTLDVLAKVALSHAKAGADMVAPSDMMDGRVGAIREALDTNGFANIPIMSYAVKYASAFYGPFREAAHSTPSFGDRRTYQMDPANRREAIQEAILDVDEGADILMVKPALAYLDIISDLKKEFPYPIAAYNVSGEYAMVKAAAQKGWLDEKKVVLESLTSMKRAGADLILTYHAADVAEWLKD